jgi:hypothetical protein
MPITNRKVKRINSAWEASVLCIKQKESKMDKNSLSKFLKHP